ncbi:substrate-binding domain-containing protein [Nocardiopsis lambiniae]|uniref:Substrate-binding domain-containing protein n=1 Tax=Nocardiopsis lambiniae TaxID=3075539 RepID=A0ABU2M4N2_9ACTN|nr:substrate-binding domain-containing protein [Nocardiopsis sp. DSM 44743]MDT0327538.1 substrate-binding domain-containing protein [Nocardiopsis sp. DSM 44743]
MSTGRHRLPSPTVTTTRRLVRSPLGISAVVVALVVAAAIAVPVGIGMLGCDETRYLRVSATQSLAPVLREAATEFNSARPSYNGDCVYAQVDEIAPHRIMAALAGGSGADSTITPHVWVPESSAWVELTRMSAGGTHGIETAPPSLAASPVVLAAPEGTEGMPDPDDTGWTLVLPGERDPQRPLVMVDPNRGADGMTVMHAVRRHLGSGDAADTAMTDFVRDVQTDSAFGEIDLATFFTGATLSGDRPAPVIVVPEQAVVSYNASRPGAAPLLRAHYPEEGTVSLDHPYVTTTDDPSLRSAAADLYEVLRDDAYRDRMRELGFRDPGGTASAALSARPGIIADDPVVHGDLTGDALLASVTDWNRLSMPSRTLVLADVSANMAEDLDGEDGPTRMEAAKRAALMGLALFPDATDMGLWLMSEDHGESGREEAADMHRLGDAETGEETTRRQELIEIAETIDVHGGGSRLYDNILSAYDEVQAVYDEEKINSVILLTAGRDEGSSDLSHGELVAALQDRFEPNRPVSLFIIAFGEQADREELRDIAAATSGSLFVTDDPDEIGDIFLSSISRRLCVPDCDN